MPTRASSRRSRAPARPETPSPTAGDPLVSVVIPVYERTRYLPAVLGDAGAAGLRAARGRRRRRREHRARRSRRTWASSTAWHVAVAATGRTDSRTADSPRRGTAAGKPPRATSSFSSTTTTLPLTTSWRVPSALELQPAPTSWSRGRGPSKAMGAPSPAAAIASRFRCATRESSLFSGTTAVARRVFGPERGSSASAASARPRRSSRTGTSSYGRAWPAPGSPLRPTPPGGIGGLPRACSALIPTGRSTPRCPRCLRSSPNRCRRTHGYYPSSSRARTGSSSGPGRPRRPLRVAHGAPRDVSPHASDDSGRTRRYDRFS